jgi:16S rRNA (guanine966-N2)-methyltransferase
LASVGKGDPSAHLRPTTDRVRENLFNVLASGRFGNPLENAQVLDLFAGTGALGFEALSRGAKRLWLIDNARKSAELIRKNKALFDSNIDITFRPWNLLQLPPCPGAPFDLVFLDPPYGKGLGQKVVPQARAKGWITNNALIIWEEQEEMLAPEGFCSLECLSFGDTNVTLMRPQ